MATPSKVPVATGAKTPVKPTVAGVRPATAASPAKATAASAKGDEIVRKSVTGTPAGSTSMVVPASEIMAAMPDFIAGDEMVLGTDGLERYTVLNRLKVVQKTASEELLETFPIGSVILSQTKDLVCGIEVGQNGRPLDEGEIVHVIPICHYREWSTWTKYEDMVEGESPVLYTTLDETDEVALKARDPSRRTEQLSDGRTVMHCEHLNFVVRIHEPDHPLHGQVAVMSFMRGQHRDGRELARMVKMRRKSIFACVFAVRTTKRENAKGTWYAFSFSNPEGRSPWVESEELYNEVRAQYDAMMDLVKGQRVKVSYDDEAREGVSQVVEDDEATPV